MWKSFPHPFILHILQGHTGSFLLRTLFAATGTLADLLAVQKHSNGKALVVIRSAFPYERIGKHLVFLLLHLLLQEGLVVLVVELMHRNITQNELLNNS